MRLSKRVNARLQLAAALIEADNEYVEALHAAEEERRAAHEASLANLPLGLHAEVQLREPFLPRPLPPIKLASDSAIFLPFRDDEAAHQALARAQARAAEIAEAHAASLANHLSAPPPPLLAGLPSQHVSSPPASSPNLLGVDLPSEHRPHSQQHRRSFLSALSDTHADPGTAHSLLQPESRDHLSAYDQRTSQAPGAGHEDDEEEDALSAWGVDKFLSADERQKTQKARQHRLMRNRSLSVEASSAVSLRSPREDGSVLSHTSSRLHPRSSLDGLDQARSDATAREGGAESEEELADRGAMSDTELEYSSRPSHFRQSRSSASSQRSRTPDPQLMARIAAYRQEATTPSGMQTPHELVPEPEHGPLASPLPKSDQGPDEALGRAPGVSTPSTEVQTLPSLAGPAERTEDNRQSVQALTGSQWHESRDGHTDFASEQDQNSLFVPRSRPASMGADSFFGLQLPTQGQEREQGQEGPHEHRQEYAQDALLQGHVGEGQYQEDHGNDLAGVGALGAAHAAMLRGPMTRSSTAMRLASGSHYPVPLAREGPVPGDPFAEWNATDAGRFPTNLDANAGSDDEDNAPLGLRFAQRANTMERQQSNTRGSLPMDGLTTRQLQILARGGTLPEYNEETQFDSSENVGRTNLLEPEEDADQSKSGNKLFGRKKRSAQLDPEMGDAETKQRRSRFGISKGNKSARKDGGQHDDVPDALNEEEEYDYDETTGQWHKRKHEGLLTRRGVDARLPRQLTLPEPLVNDTHLVQLLPPGMRQVQLQRQLVAQERAQIAELSMEDPQKARSKGRGLHVPPGFVLHDGQGLPPVRFLTVEAAAARTHLRDLRTRDPAERAKNRELARTRLLERHKDADENIDAFLRSDRAAEIVVPIPADAPPTLQERAATATTALFRNHLVHDPADQDGWGWDSQALAESTILDATDEAERRQARFKISARQKRKMEKAKRARRKERRRRRRARDEITEAGGVWEGGAISSDSSPDEWESAHDSDSDSSLLSEESEPERWVDEGPAAGTLYGKSLLDLAEQRGQTRKKQTRYVYYYVLTLPTVHLGTLPA